MHPLLTYSLCTTALLLDNAVSAIHRQQRHPKDLLSHIEKSKYECFTIFKIQNLLSNPIKVALDGDCPWWCLCHKWVLGICVSSDQLWSWSSKAIRRNIGVWHKETGLAENLAAVAFISEEMEQSFSLITRSLWLYPSSQFQSDAGWVSPNNDSVLLGPVLTALSCTASVLDLARDASDRLTPVIPLRKLFLSTNWKRIWMLVLWIVHLPHVSVEKLTHNCCRWC